MRVSTLWPPMSACSGLMYAGVPTIWLLCVCIVLLCTSSEVAFAIPKSIILGVGSCASFIDTMMFDGFISLCMMPLVCACCIA